MRKSKQFVAMPVISLEEGQQIGIVKGLVINPAQRAVAALVIEQKGWFKEQKFIPYTKVRSVGDDAITVDRNNNVQKSASLPEIVNLLKEKTEITGSRIVAENGTVLGHVDEYYVDLESGEIVGLEFSYNFISSVMKGRAFLDINFVRTIGKNVVICTNDSLDNIVKMDGGLQDTVRTFRDSTNQIWGTTMQKTKELSSAINKSLEKIKKDKKEDDESKISSERNVSATEVVDDASPETLKEAPVAAVEKTPDEEPIAPAPVNGEAKEDTVEEAKPVSTQAIPDEEGNPAVNEPTNPKQ